MSTTAPAARFTRATGPLVDPSELDPPPLRLLLEAPAREPPRFAADARLPEERLLDARLPEDFFAEPRLLEARLLDFFADPRFDARLVDFFADDRFAEDFFADDFFAEERFADERFAEDFFAEDFFADERFDPPLDLRAEDFFAPPLRAPVFFVADAPEVRVLRRAVPRLRVDVLPEDLERVAIGELLVGGGVSHGYARIRHRTAPAQQPRATFGAN
ncbi:hypothetical protein J421_0511 [Gemmatirosa kalamazoonensis]|uniref:Uncharacterized protein n=1 Tax=Gemmatirosa kalamazoonensis TaxID=861299 RepID=W0RF86_9BACT|nr:hypothetical protein [Gemmatirosa kalamazoonensis]AHG88048.1 hypothetical protein J421_0511 [Gemmatirosa kalamazoonensis]